MDFRPIFIIIGIFIAAIVGIVVLNPIVFHANDPSFDMGGYWVSMAIGTPVALVAAAAIGGTIFGTFMLFGARNDRALKSHQLVRFDLDAEMTLVHYERPVHYRGLRRPLVGDEDRTESISLPAARYASWMITPILGVDESLVQFWDSDPKLQLDLFGPQPTNPNAVLLGTISLDELSNSPAIKRAVLAYLATKTALGEFEANVDLDSGELLVERRPPLASGVRLEDGAIIREPGEGNSHDERSS